MISEYSRYGLDRAWFYYPDALPANILSEKVRNGQLDPKLSFPLEDLYGDGQPCGQVGQEIYGCGAAFIYAARAFHRRPGLPFDLFCDRRVEKLELSSEQHLHIMLDSPAGCATRFALRRAAKEMPSTLRVETAYGPCPPLVEALDRLEFEAPSGCRSVTITW